VAIRRRSRSSKVGLDYVSCSPYRVPGRAAGSRTSRAQIECARLGTARR
jgi:hypothetical protein